MAFRILILGDASSPHLLRWVQALEGQGVQTLTLSMEPPLSEYPRFVSIPSRKPSRLRYLLAIPEVLRQASLWSPHLVFAHFLPNYGFISALLPLQIPRVLALWGSDLLVIPEGAWWKYWISRRVLKGHDLLIVDARMLRDRLWKRFLVPPQRVWILPYGVRREVREGVCLGQRRRDLIIHTRRLSPELDPWTIIEAMSHLQRRRVPLRLKMVGWGDLYASVRASVYERGLYDRVQFVKPVPEPRIPSLYCEGTLYLSASLSDSTSVSLLEAMALGLLPVVSDIPGNREWVVHKLNGLLFEPGNAKELADRLEEAFVDQELQKRASHVNPILIEERANWEKEITRLVSGLKGLTFGRRVPRW